jgi:hypothetical protein
VPQKNITLVYENFADRGQLSGGSWRASLPLANLQTPYLPEIARSTSAAATSTWFDVMLPTAQPVGGIVLGPANVTAAATARIRAFTSAAYSVTLYDSGVIPFPGAAAEFVDLEWEDEAFWDGDIRGFGDALSGAYLFHLPPTIVTSRFWRIELFDQANPQGYLNIGRLLIGRRWRPEYNYDEGDNSLSFEVLTDQEESRSGTKFFNPRATRRVFQFSFSRLPDTISFAEVFRIVVRSGLHNQVAVIPNPDDPNTFQREALLGTLRQPPSLRRYSMPQFATSFVIEESI